MLRGREIVTDLGGSPDDLCAESLADLGNLGVVGRDDDPLDGTGGESALDRPCDERLATERAGRFCGGGPGILRGPG